MGGYSPSRAFWSSFAFFLLRFLYMHVGYVWCVLRKGENTPRCTPNTHIHTALLFYLPVLLFLCLGQMAIIPAATTTPSRPLLVETLRLGGDAGAA